MREYNRVFIVGHPGAGKAFLAKELAKKLGWKFIDANFDLEIRIGKMASDILGAQGEIAFGDCLSHILELQSKQENIVVATDSGVVYSERNRQLLESGFVVNLKASMSVQMERMSQNTALLLNTNLKSFLEKLHHEYDELYNVVSDFSVDSDDSALEKHVVSIENIILKNKTTSEKFADSDDLVIFHKTKHTPVHLSAKQAQCLTLLADGKSSKEIAEIIHISHRTVEDYIAKNMEILGCASSKELIALYHDQPGKQ